MKLKLPTILKRKPKAPEGPLFHHEHKKAIELAFSWQGVNYYRFKNDLEMPAGRYKEAQTFFNELDMRCSRDFLKKYVKAVESSVNDGNIGRISVMTNELKTRLDYLTEIDILLRLASVLYFTLEENIFDYDGAYNDAKIQGWKDSGLNSFFLQTPTKEFIPFSDLSVKDLEQYSKIQTAKTLGQIRLFSEFISKKS